MQRALRNNKELFAELSFELERGCDWYFLATLLLSVLFFATRLTTTFLEAAFFAAVFSFRRMRDAPQPFPDASLATGRTAQSFGSALFC